MAKEIKQSTSAKATADKAKEKVEAPKNLILKDARITEKAAGFAQFSVYLFNVAFGATKSEIAKAFQAKYNKKPVKVNTVNMLPKTYARRGTIGRGTYSKKAYVFLPKGVTIDVI